MAAGPASTILPAAFLVEVSSTVNAGLRTITVRDSIPIAGTVRRFMRLQITQP